MGEIRQMLTTPSPEMGKIASPELAVISSVFGWRPDSIGLARAVFFAVALELLGAFVPSAVWFLRPQIGTRSSAPTTAQRAGKVAVTRNKPTPRSPIPAPAAPSRRINDRKAPMAKRGRKRDPNVIDFVLKFRERHGRSPNIPEMRAQFPGLHKSTLWRAARLSFVEGDCPQRLSP